MTIDANNARNISSNGGSGWTFPDPNNPNKPCHMLVFDSISQAANNGRRKVTLNVRKSAYPTFKSNMTGYGYNVCMPQGIIECSMGLIDNADDPNAIKYTNYDTVVVSVSW